MKAQVLNGLKRLVIAPSNVARCLLITAIAIPAWAVEDHGPDMPEDAGPNRCVRTVGRCGGGDCFQQVYRVVNPVSTPACFATEEAKECHYGAVGITYYVQIKAYESNNCGGDFVLVSGTCVAKWASGDSCS